MLGNRDLIALYIQRAWEKCAHAETPDLTDECSEVIDSLYDILAQVSDYERSLIATLDVD
jgi:hypothetical protein